MADVVMPNGWIGPNEAERELASSSTPPEEFRAYTGTPPERVQLWRAIRAIRGDFPPATQETGDCVSWATRMAVITTAAVEIERGDKERLVDLFPPFFYGSQRVFVGRGRLRSAPGSLGVWARDAIKAYGSLEWTANWTYSGAVADSWGVFGPPQETRDQAKPFVMEHSARIQTIEQMVSAIASGYAIVVCASQGFEPTPDRTGLLPPSSRPWNHATCAWGYDLDRQEVEFVNSWGDLHGRVQDRYDTRETLPRGSFRIRFQDAAKMLADGDSWAFSNYRGFPPRESKSWVMI